MRSSSSSLSPCGGRTVIASPLADAGATDANGVVTVTTGDMQSRWAGTTPWDGFFTAHPPRRCSLITTGVASRRPPINGKMGHLRTPRPYTDAVERPRAHRPGDWTRSDRNAVPASPSTPWVGGVRNLSDHDLETGRTTATRSVLGWGSERFVHRDPEHDLREPRTQARRFHGNVTSSGPTTT